MTNDNHMKTTDGGPGTYFDPKGSANIVHPGPVVENPVARKTVAFLGGSITEMDGFRPRVMAALRAKYPDVAFTEIAAGLSSTCSDAAAFRMERDLLAQGTPDVLVVDEAVNDAQDGHFDRQQSVRGLEGVIRRTFAANPKAVIVIALMLNKEEYDELVAGREPFHYAVYRSVAAHYGLEVADVGSALAASAAKGGFDWTGYGDCHPSPAGCDFVADIVMASLGKAFDPYAVPVAKELPEPMDKWSYCNGRELPLEGLEASDGWQVAAVDWNKIVGEKRDYFMGGKVLWTDRAGAVQEIPFSGRALAAFVTAGPDAGDLEISVDGGPWTRQRARADWPPLHYPYVQMLADGLPEGKHRVAVRTVRAVRETDGGEVLRIHRLYVN